MHICTPSEPQVSEPEAPHVAEFPLRTKQMSLYHQKSEKKLYWQTLQHLLDVLIGRLGDTGAM